MGEVHVRIPGPLRPFTDGAGELRTATGTVTDIIAAVGARHPQLLPRLLTPEGELRPYVNVFVGHDNIRDLQGLATIVTAGAVVHILPAVAGG